MNTALYKRIFVNLSQKNIYTEFTILCLLFLKFFNVPPKESNCLNTDKMLSLFSFFKGTTPNNAQGIMFYF